MITEEKDSSIKVLSSLNKRPKFLGVDRDLLIPWAVIIGTFFSIFNVFLSWNDIWWITLSFWFCAAWGILCGGKSYDFTNRFIPLPGKAYFNSNSLFVAATDKGSFSRKMRQKVKPQTFRTRTGKKEKLVPFQIESDLHSILRIKIDDEDFSVLLRCDKENSWSASIPFALEGIHPEISSEAASAQLESLRESFKDIPFGETITILLSCHSSYRKRLVQLRSLLKKTKLPFMKVILASEEHRLKEITAKGFRQEWTHYAFCTWTQDKQDLRRQSDLLGRTVNWLRKTINSYGRKLIGTENSHKRDIYCQLATEIYNNSYSPWKINLSTKAGLIFRPLSPEEIWEDLMWYRFNQDLDSEGNLLPVPPIPQLVTVSQVGKKTEHKVQLTNPKHPRDTVSILIEGQRGHFGTPQHYERRDLVGVNNKFVAAVSLAEPPEKWKPEPAQLTWLWERTTSYSIKDTEIWAQFSNGDKEESKLNLQRLAKQSNISQLNASTKAIGKDVEAIRTFEDSVVAQERIDEGALPLFVAVTILVYRDDPNLLEAACQKLDDSFGTAKLVRERTICWKLWNETFPFNCRKQLKSSMSFSERRPTLDTTSGVGLAPLVKPKTLDSDGVELIYKGGYPIHINLFKKNGTAIITGTKGSGKSILAFAYIREALAHNIPVVGLDLSNAGESTFELVTSLLGDKGSYINILKQYVNILQLPDLRGFATEEKDKRRKLWEDFTRKVITSIAMGQIDDQHLLEAVDSIVVRTLNLFLTDPTINERYRAAFNNGWQSSQWQDMPTLHDFLFFCSKEKLGIFNAGEIEERAINQIVNQIEAKLQDPIIGRAIGSPSNVPPDPLMKFFGLSGLNNKNNQYIMSLVAHLACFNTSLENPRSLSIFDECPSLFKQRGFADLVGQRFSIGRKEGQSVLVIGQNVDAIFKCSAASEILDNTDFHLIGKITPNAAKFISKELDIPSKTIYRNASEAYEPNTQYGYSHWLVFKQGRSWDCRYFPSVFGLAALANSPEEKAARNLILEKFPSSLKGRLNGVSSFARSYNKTRNFNS